MKKQLFVLYIMSFVIFFSAPEAVFSSSCDEYHAVPPFLSSKLEPNVMFMLDNSGSMKVPLYNKGYRCKTDGTATNFDSTKDYYGYFLAKDSSDARVFYKYDSTIPVDDSGYDGGTGDPYNVDIFTTTTGAFVEDDCTPGVNATTGLGKNCWSGNFLNWVSTRRIDAARKVMMGGKLESRSGYDYIGGDDGDLEYKLVANNERSDNTICKQDSDGQDYTPFPDDTVFKVASPADNVEIIAKYDAYAKIIVNDTGTKFIFNEDGDIIGESGKVSSFGQDSYAGNWHTVNFQNPAASPYGTDPVVVVGPLKYGGADPTEYRVSDVTQASFKVRSEEWDYKGDGGHAKEDIFYIVLQEKFNPGHVLPNGQTLIATHEDVSDTVESFSFSQTFAEVPVVLASVITNNEPNDVVTVRLDDVTTANCKIQLQEQEAGGGTGSGGSHANEKVSIIALPQGVYNVGGAIFEVGAFDSNPDGNDGTVWTTLPLANTGDLNFLAAMQTRDDADTASLRYTNLKTNSIDILVQEELSLNDEINHANESIGFLSIRPLQYNLAVIVEKEPEGVLQDLEEDVRLGLSFYRYNKDNDIYNGEKGHGGTMSLDIPLNPFAKDPFPNDPATQFRRIDTPIKAPIADIIDGIEHYPLVWGTTPLAENYYEILRYFQQDTPYYDVEDPIDDTYTYKVYDPLDTTPEPLWDPYYFDEYGQTIRCAKSFILLFTDGQPYRDAYIPKYYDSSGAGGTPDTVEYDGNNVQADCPKTGVDDNCNDLLDDLSYWAFWDKDGTPTYRDLRDETGMDGDQYITTYTVAFGTGTIPGILQDTADNGDGVAYAAEDGEQLKTALTEAFSSILKKTSAGSSISVLTERATEGSVIHQALFFPEKTYLDDIDSYSVGWTGTLSSYWFFNDGTVANIREDNATGSDGDHYFLDKYDDHAISFRIDGEGALKIDHYDLVDDGSSNDGGTGALAGTYTDVDDITRIWEGGKILKDREVLAVPSVVGNNGGRMVYGIDYLGAMEEFIAKESSTSSTQSTFVNSASWSADQFGLKLTDVPDCLGTVADAANPTADELLHRAENLMSFTRGASDDFTSNGGSEKCRSRQVDDDGNIWKLGDIIYSTPKLIPYDEHSLLITGANDGMLHAFHVGKVRTDGLATDQVVKLCDSKTGDCEQDVLGDELWSFIPQNAMPYLKYFADPDYKHMYSIDLAPYYINDGGQKIIIGGMRFGGATGSTKVAGSITTWLGDDNVDKVQAIGNDSTGVPLQVVPPNCSPDTPENCLGYSSYFALDVTDPEEPIFLWEYSHPRLGFTFSGPAFIKRGTKRYVMFLSGPLNYKGDAVGKDLKMFFIEVDSDFKNIHEYLIDGAAHTGFTKTSVFSSFSSSFGGRLFTHGIDYNRDGNTEAVFFGVTTGSNDSDSWVGDVVVLAPSDDDPIDSTSGKINWEITKVYNEAGAAITTKVEYSLCFDTPFIYFGSGRWFFKDDAPGSTSQPLAALFGIQMSDCMADLVDDDDKTTCSGGFNSAAATKVGDEFCSADGTLASLDKLSWVIRDDEMLPNGGGYLRERGITDPTPTPYDITFFTTTQPSSDVCAFGGRSRIWGVNCLTGHGMFDGCDDYKPVVPQGTLLLQLSGGNIEEVDLTEDDFTGKHSDWMIGIPPDALPPPNMFSGSTGEILLWIER